MASKTLTAKVKLDTKSAEDALKRLEKLLNNIDKVANKKSGKGALEKQTERALLQQQRLQQATLKTKLAEEKLTTQKEKTALAAQRVKNATDQASKSAHNLGKGFSSAKSNANGLLQSVKRLAGAYLGMQTLKLGITASDTVTSTQNRLNALEGGNPKQTAEVMDKIYTASQRARSGYDDMLKNVSKTMTLAPSAFQGNIDNAIRFQEIMSKSYTIGGASDTEASTSMYQLVQALGSGVLQGDELRSVREGAPIAYKQIEKFAQGVYKTEESLKDLASQGKITSDMVVAAIMQSGDEIDKKFNDTKVTFEQAWTQIKNTAMKAFQPALESLNKMLSSDAGKKMIEGLCKGMVILGNTLSWVIDLFSKFFNWCADNWEWLKYVIVGAIIVLIVYFGIMAAQAIWSALQTAWAWIQAYWPLLLIVAGIMGILYVYELWRQGTITTTEAIVYCLLVIGAVFLIVAAIMTAGIWLIIALVILGIAAIIYWFSECCGAVTWFGILCKNIGLEIAGFFKALAWVIANAFMTAVEFVVDIFNGCCSWVGALFINLGETIKNIATNIGIAFSNAWNGALSTFWNFIASCMEGLDWLAKPIEAIAKLFGKSFDYSSFIDSIRNKAAGYDAKQKEYVKVNGFEKGWSGDAWNAGVNKWSAPKWAEDSSWSEMQDSVGGFEKGWSKDAYNIGYKWGQGIEDKVNAWGSQWQTEVGEDDEYAGIFSDIAKKLGLTGSGLPDPTDPKYSVGGYDPSKALDKLGNIEDDTGKISDSMDLENDDLEYLRKIAEMEWRKEFTTAEIKVDMSNYNTINDDRDLDGIVTYLSDVLRAEMTSVAEGVHY